MDLDKNGDRVEEMIMNWMAAVGLGVVLFVGILFIEPLAIHWWAKRRREAKTERSYALEHNKGRADFSSILTSNRNDLVDFTLVVVASDGQAMKLAILLDETIAFLRRRSTSRVQGEPNLQKQHFSFEIIVADISHSKEIVNVTLRFTNTYSSNTVKLLELNSFKGRGAAIIKALDYSRGRHILMMNGDGSNTIEDLARFEAELDKIENKETGEGLVFGSRVHLQQMSQRRDNFESFLESVYQYLFQFLCVRDVFDSSCQFTLMSRDCAKRLLPNLHLQSLGIDAEMLFLADQFGIPSKEVAVRWWSSEKASALPFGGKPILIRDLVSMRLAYLLGLWKC